jgi:hypothetical protein
MHAIKRPIGFGGVEQVAEFFGVPVAVVKEKAATGAWPSYVIANRRVFDIDELLALAVKASDKKAARPLKAGGTDE